MTDTIPNVPRDLLERVLYLMDNYIGTTHPEEDEIRAILSTPSPAGVDVLGNTAKLLLPALRQYMHNDGSGLLAGYDLETTQAIIDGLRGEVADLRSMLATVSQAGIRVRTERDQHAKRIGELEGLLRESGKTIHKLQAEQPTPARIARYLDAMRGQIDAALSAGKDSD